MNHQQQVWLYLLPYIISLTITTGVGLYAWQRRSTAGALSYALFTWMQSSMTIGYILELLSPNLEGKIFWDNIQFIGMLYAPVFILQFALEYTGRMRLQHRRILLILKTIPLIFLLLVFTDYQHGLVRPATWLVTGSPFRELTYDFTALFWVMALFAYCLTIFGLLIIVRRFFHPAGIYRLQTGTILIGVLIPILGTIPTMLGFQLTFHRDNTPFTFALGNLVIAWGLFYYRLLEIVPIARETVIENLSDAVIVLDTKDRIVDINPAAKKLGGFSTPNLIGQPVDQIYSNWSELIDQYRHAGDTHTLITVSEDEGTKYFDLSISSLYSRRGKFTGRAIVVRDISQQKLAEIEVKKHSRRLEAANQQLKILTRAKDEFVSNVSHELRTPITNIKLYLDLQQARPEYRKIYADTIGRETDRLTNMLEALLLLSRLDQGRLKLDIEACDLNILVEDFVKDRSFLSERRHLKISTEIEPSLPPINADPRLLEQVLSILLTNALNYTPAGGRIVIATHKRPSQDENWAGFTISDSGPGIPPEEQEQLFGRFFRGKAGLASKLPGTGLGLAIAKEIIDHHKGSLEVQSSGQPGDGATFMVWLPA